MNIIITTTYSIIDDEHAEIGDYKEVGEYDETTFESVSEASEYICENGGIHPSETPEAYAKSWTTEDDINYTTGDRKAFTYHIKTDEITLKQINQNIINYWK